MTHFKLVLLAAILHSAVVLAATTNTFPADGNVGIGTTSPSAKLDVRGHVVFDAMVGPTGSGQWGGPILWLSTAATDQSRYLLIANSPLTSMTSGIKAGGILCAENLDYANPSKNDLIVKGNVGIGTNNPTAKLTVIGTISAKEVKVTTTGFPDYVFADDYKLRTLNEVEAHIKQHKHLPGIPSAAEVERDGLALSEISKKQMEKIEELTLYAIEQQKENNELKSRVQKLENLIDAIAKGQ